MTEILRNQVFNLIPGTFQTEGLARLLWFDIATNRAVLIHIDQTKRQAPHTISVSELLDAIEQKHAVLTHLKPDPRSLMSEEQLSALYPPSHTGAPAFPVAYRKYWRSIIEPIISEAEQYFQGKRSLGSLVANQARTQGESRQQIYLVLYRFWAAGSVISALLPNSSRCGGKGKHRAGSAIRLGRKSLRAKLTASANDNYPLTDEDIERLQFGWRTFLAPNVSVGTAYDRTMRTFYVREWDTVNGALSPIILPKGERPSPVQFRYHGERQENGNKAWKCHLSEREWLLKHRPLGGEPGVGHARIGAVGQADASTNDVHLVSVFDRLKIVGPCHWLLIVDEFTGMIVGLYVGWGVDAEAAKLAMLSASSSKVDFCARYGIQITEDEFPSALFNVVTVDRGEFNCEAVRSAFEEINSSLEYVQVGRGDLKPQVEAKHHVLHALSSHQLPGTTRGKQRERGQTEPALDACLTLPEFTADLLRAALYHNNRAPVPDLLTTEMKQDGVLPTRANIWRWAKSKGYVAYTECDEDRLIINLCPSIEAVVQPNGVYLVYRGELTGGHTVIIKSLRYLGPIAEQRNWLETARRRGRFRIQVYYNPYDLRRVSYLDPEMGLQHLALITSDPLLSEPATLTEFLLSQSEVTLQTQDLEHEATQARVDMAINRELAISQAKNEKKDRLSSLECRRAFKSTQLCSLNFTQGL